MTDPEQIDDFADFDAQNDAEEVLNEEMGEKAEYEDEDEMMVDGDEEELQETIHFEDDSIQGYFDHKAPVYCVAMHPTLQQVVVTGGGDDKSHLWRQDNGELVATLPQHDDSVSAVAFSADGKFVASGGMDGKVHVCHAVNGQLVITLEGPTEITCLQWHPKGNVLVAASNDGTLWMWSLPTGACMNVFTGQSDAIHQVKFTHNGKFLVSCSEDGSVVMWDPKTAAVVKRFALLNGQAHEGPVYAVDIYQDDHLLLTAGEDGFARLTNMTTGKMLAQFDHQEAAVECAVFCNNVNPSVCATGDVNGVIRVFDLQNYRLRHTLNHDDAITKLMFHHASHTLYSSSMDKTIKVWDIKTGECLKTWSGHQEGILDFAVSADGQRVVSVGDDEVSLVFGF